MIILTTERSPASFRSHFSDIILLPDNPCLDSRVSHHTDLSLFSFGDTVVCAPFIYGILSRMLPETEVICGEQPCSPYPGDILFNAALVGDMLLCNLKNTSATVLAEAEKRGIRPVNVSQGYAKCSTVPVSGSALITSDVSVGLAAEKEGLDVLVVTNEGVSLPGFEYGFIGGASVSLENEIVFTGDLYSMRDAVRIEEFIRAHGKRAVFFPGEQLIDIGSPSVVF